jgi:hypothetical protein
MFLVTLVLSRLNSHTTILRKIKKSLSRKRSLSKYVSYIVLSSLRTGGMMYDDEIAFLLVGFFVHYMD